MIQLRAPSSGNTRDFMWLATLTVHYGDSQAIECTSVIHSLLRCIVVLNECTRERLGYVRNPRSLMEGMKTLCRDDIGDLPGSPNHL